MIKESYMRKFIAAIACAVVVGGIGVPVAQADFGIVAFDTSLEVGGAISRQAGAHPDFVTDIRFSTEEPVRTVKVDLPAGMVGNPTVTDKCTAAQMIALAKGLIADCPPTSQIGTIDIYQQPDDSTPFQSKAVYNLVAPSNLPALFAFNYSGAVVRIEPRLRASDYGISSDIREVSNAIGPIGRTTLTLWGVPADDSHQRMGPGIPDPAPRRALFTSPTSCPAGPVGFAASVDSWLNTGVFLSATADADMDGAPYQWDGCEQLPFDPSISVDPGSHVADAPSGLAVDVSVPQNDNPDGLATAHVRKVVTRFPEGMSVSPSSAAGLGACALADIKLGTNDQPSCPASSEIGSVSIDTPLLDDPLQGDVILAAQDDNPFHSLLALYIVARGPGILVKLPGRVDTDPVSGQITATFDNTPQLPFSHLNVTLRGGPRAPLATPTACGTYNTHAEVTSWASDDVVSLDAPMVISEGCEPVGFAPSFSAGSLMPFAGESSPFRFALTRADRSQFLSRVDSTMPGGLLARIKDAVQCPEPQASNGTCTRGTEIGSTSVLSGPGEQPLALTGRVYLTGPYKGAPFGLSIVVPTKGQAGPFDLGDVVVRAAVHVDPETAQVSVRSDPFPTIIDGFPLRLRQAVVSIDKPGFMVNPTSCAQKQIDATVTSTQGATAERTAKFRVRDCAGLAFTPKLGLRLTGKKQMKSGGHPALRARLTQKAGQANIAKAKVTLPKNVVLDSKNAYDPKLVCDYDKAKAADCPASSKIGKASLNTPILAKPLTGAVHLVQGIRFGPTGNRIRTLPTLLVKLRGEVAINLRSTTSVDRKSRLISTFPKVPDAPATRFTLQINGGHKGILTVTENRQGRINLCNQKQTALIETNGQNGKNADYPTHVKTPCAKKKGGRRGR